LPLFVTTIAGKIISLAGRAVGLTVDRITIVIARPAILTVKILPRRAIIVKVVRIADGNEEAMGIGKVYRCASAIGARICGGKRGSRAGNKDDGGHSR
jgi:hypothetical protein